MIKDNLDRESDNRDPSIISRLSTILRPIMNNRGEVNAGPGDTATADAEAATAAAEAATAASEKAAASKAAAESAAAQKVGVGEGWRGGLDSSIKDHPALVNFKTVSDLAKSHVEAQRFIGREKIPMPPKDAKPEDWDVVYNALGRPSDPTKYGLPDLQYPEGLTKASDEQNAEFQTVAHKLGLLPHQLTGLMQWNHERNVGHFTKSNEATTAALQKAEGELRKEYGHGYDAKLGLVQKLLARVGDEGTTELIEGGLGNDPRFIRMMAKIASHFGEDGTFLQGEAASVTMSPEEATEEIAKIQNDKAHPYRVANHPEHKKAVAHVAALFEMAHPNKRPVRE